jgi:hypothetical protein
VPRRFEDRSLEPSLRRSFLVGGRSDLHECPWKVSLSSLEVNCRGWRLTVDVALQVGINGSLQKRRSCLSSPNAWSFDKIAITRPIHHYHNHSFSIEAGGGPSGDSSSFIVGLSLYTTLLDEMTEDGRHETRCSSNGRVHCYDYVFMRGSLWISSH